MKFFPLVDNEVAQASSLLLFPEKQNKTKHIPWKCFKKWASAKKVVLSVNQYICTIQAYFLLLTVGNDRK